MQGNSQLTRNIKHRQRSSNAVSPALQAISLHGDLNHLVFLGGSPRCSFVLFCCFRCWYRSLSLMQDVDAKRKLGIAGHALGKALATHDQDALEKLWSPQMIVNGPNNNVLTRAEIFEGMKTVSSTTKQATRPRSRRSSSLATSLSLWAKTATRPPLALTKASRCTAVPPTYGSTRTVTG
jgi:hypothetical protein